MLVHDIIDAFADLESSRTFSSTSCRPTRSLAIGNVPGCKGETRVTDRAPRRFSRHDVDRDESRNAMLGKLAVPEIRELIDAHDDDTLREVVNRWHSADLADLVDCTFDLPNRSMSSG